MTLTAGARFGPYEIVSALGAGGMGEVYRARDSKLDRDVAIKVLPEQVASDPAALSRFEREAKAVAALSHPGILAIHDFGKQDQTAYAVMELLEGQTLRDVIASGPLPARKAADYAAQVARALAAAHEKGIVHRDLKPENLFLLKDGRIKVLDFGLAAQRAPIAKGGDDVSSPTFSRYTDPGAVLGTAGYMAPEQVRGQTVDHRADIFAFGAVLYEMLTGRRAFKRDTAAETMTAILKEDPPEPAWLAHPVPVALQRVVERCLEKSPDSRFRSAEDLAFALELSSGASHGETSAAQAPLGRRGRPLWPVVVAALAGVLLAAGYLRGYRVLRPTTPSFQQLTFRHGYVQSALFAPDSQVIAYGAAFGGQPTEVSTTRVDSMESRPMGFPPGDVVGISRSGDMAILLNRRFLGSWISVGTLAKASLGGGAPREILENVNDTGISPDGQQFAVVRQVGSRQQLEFPIGKVIFETHGWISHPRIASDGLRIAFADHPVYGDDRGFVTLIDDGKPVRLTGDYSSLTGIAWARVSDEILFSGSATSEDGSIWAVSPGHAPRSVLRAPIELVVADADSRGRLLVSSGVRTATIAGMLLGDSVERDLSMYGDEDIGGLSADGRVMAASQTAQGSGSDYQVYARSADASGTVKLGPGDAITVSPDGKWVCSYLPTGSRKSLHLYPTGAGEMRTLELGNVTFVRSVVKDASWSADGRRIAFPGFEAGTPLQTYVLDLAGGPPRRIATAEIVASVLAPDGRSVAIFLADGTTAIHPVAGGASVQLKGFEPGELPVAWQQDGSALFVWDRSLPARIFRIEIATGKRELWKELKPSDPVGMLYGRLQMTADGKHYIYRCRTILNRLYLVEGLQ